MSNDWFRFKQFTVHQSGSAMKVGTDGVLLGAWCGIHTDHLSYLDIGTGTGLIPLMLAQRVVAAKSCAGTERAAASAVCVAAGSEDSVSDLSVGSTPATLPSGSGAVADVRIDGVEIDCGSALQAARNVAESPWSGMIHIYTADIRNFACGSGSRAKTRCGAVEMPDIYGGMELDGGWSECVKYDHIVSNPPWFVDSLKSPHDGRTVARHTSSLPYGELIRCVCRMLSRQGVFSTILPYDAGRSFADMASASGLALIRRTAVSTLPGAPPKRLLMEFAFDGEEALRCREDILTIGTGTAGGFSEEYRKLTREFYLKF